MNRKTTGIIAGSAGAALLIGGGTFALWNDAASVDATTITTGNLDLVAAACADTDPAATVLWLDTSEDREDAGHEIDAATWRTVPGDTAEGTYCFSAALEGDNLVAAIGAAVDGGTAGSEGSFEGAGYEASWHLEYLDGATWTKATGLFASEDNPQPGAAPADLLPALPAVTSTTTANVRVRISLAVASPTTLGAPGTNGNVAAQTDIDLDALAVSLTQVRADAAGEGGFVAAP